MSTISSGKAPEIDRDAWKSFVPKSEDPDVESPFYLLDIQQLPNSNVLVYNVMNSKTNYITALHCTESGNLLQADNIPEQASIEYMHLVNGKTRKGC